MSKLPLKIKLIVPVQEELLATPVYEVPFNLYFAAAEVALRADGRYENAQVHLALQNLYGLSNRANRVSLSRAGARLSARIGGAPVEHTIETVIAKPVVVVPEVESAEVPRLKSSVEAINLKRIATRKATAESRARRTEADRVGREVLKAARASTLFDLFETEVIAP
jgi:hypothetical protein